LVTVFTGDPFLAGRAFRQAIAAAVAVGADVRRLGEGLDAAAVGDAASQGGLFGAPMVALDLDEAFLATGAGATAARNAVVDTLDEAAARADLLVLDSGATPARQKRYRERFDLRHTPTPRFGELLRWAREELATHDVSTTGDVAGVLIDLFGEDLAAIASEVAKLQALGEPVDPERVRRIAHRPAARSAFDLIDAVVLGETATALALARALVTAGEAPARVMATLGWQIELVAGCVAFLDDGGVGVDAAAKALAASPFPTRKALAVAERLDEEALARLVDTFVTADARMKAGGDPEWQLESCVVALSRALERRPEPRRRR
jgi:DNA polymerase III subunit delta